MRFFVDVSGVYLGGFEDGKGLPAGALEVPRAPGAGEATPWSFARQAWRSTAPRYFIDATGNYLGCFTGAEPPDGAIEIITPPDHGAQKWTGAGWTPPPAPPAPVKDKVDQLIDALVTAGKITRDELPPELKEEAIDPAREV